MIDWSSPKTTEGLTLRVTHQYRTQQTMNSARTQAGAITTFGYRRRLSHSPLQLILYFGPKDVFRVFQLCVCTSYTFFLDIIVGLKEYSKAQR